MYADDLDKQYVATWTDEFTVLDGSYQSVSNTSETRRERQSGMQMQVTFGRAVTFPVRRLSFSVKNDGSERVGLDFTDIMPTTSSAGPDGSTQACFIDWATGRYVELCTFSSSAGQSTRAYMNAFSYDAVYFGYSYGSWFDYVNDVGGTWAYPYEATYQNGLPWVTLGSLAGFEFNLESDGNTYHLAKEVTFTSGVFPMPHGDCFDFIFDWYKTHYCYDFDGTMALRQWIASGIEPSN
jgi:hypothetical protein